MSESSCTEAAFEGLKHLMGLAKLESVNLFGTKVTAAGVKALRQALARVRIGPF